MENLRDTSLRTSWLDLEYFIIIYSVILLYSERKVVMQLFPMQRGN